MDTNRNNIICEKYIQILQEETPIESAVPVPGEKTLGAVLWVCPQLQVEKTEVLEGRVKVSGTLALHVAAEDEERRLYCFDAAADFTQTLKGEGLTAGMQAQVTAQLKNCELRQENGGLRLYALLEVRAFITESVTVEAISSLGGGRNLEQKTLQFTEEKKLLLGAKSLRLREEEGVEEGTVLLGYTACLAPLKTEQAGSSAGVEGCLCWELLLLPPSGNLTQRTLRQPFTETVPLQGAGDQPPYARGEITGAQAVIRGEALLMEADVSLSIYGQRLEVMTLLEDAYDKEGTFSCQRQEIECRCCTGSFSEEVPVSGRLEVPGHLPECEQVLAALGLPVLLGTEKGEEDAEMKGAGKVLVTTVYRCPQGLLHSFTAEVPFEKTLTGAGETLMAEARLTELQVKGSGRTLRAEGTVLVEGERYARRKLCYTGSLCAQTSEPGYTGVLLYFAEGGESLFSLGKQFRIPIGELREMNPHLQEPLEKGTQVLLLK